MEAPRPSVQTSICRGSYCEGSYQKDTLSTKVTRNMYAIRATKVTRSTCVPFALPHNAVILNKKFRTLQSSTQFPHTFLRKKVLPQESTPSTFTPTIECQPSTKTFREGCGLYLTLTRRPNPTSTEGPSRTLHARTEVRQTEVCLPNRSPDSDA